MIRIHERIGERNYYAVGNEKVIREQLNEENQQALEEIHDKYKKLKETLFDTSLTTTDTKQAVANILTSDTFLNPICIRNINNDVIQCVE